VNEPRQRRVGAYAKLLANYASDDAIIEAGQAAELLFVRGLAFLSTSDSDGYITDAQVIRYVGAGMRDAMKRAQRLAEVGVWERVDGGFNVRSWLRIHESAEEKGRKKAQDRERKRTTPTHPPVPPDSGRNPNGFHERGASESLLGSYVSSNQPTEQSTARQSRATTGQGTEPAAAAAPPSMYCSEHPNGTEKPCGPCGTAKLAYKAWMQARLDGEVSRKQARVSAVAACDLCDENGLRLDPETKLIIGRCDHRRSA
jgi:hypothetical protein